MWKRRNNNVKLYETFRDFSVSVLRKCYSEIIQIDCAKHLLAEIDPEEGKEPVFEKQDQLIPKVLEKLRIPGEEVSFLVRRAPILRLLLRIRGNGLELSTAIGVSTGKTFAAK